MSKISKKLKKLKISEIFKTLSDPKKWNGYMIVTLCGLIGMILVAVENYRSVKISPSEPIIVTSTTQEYELFISDDSDDSKESHETSLYNGKADLNLATWEDISRIDGIGERTAKRITAYRTLIGAYDSVGQVADVDGVGEKTVEELRKFFYVEEEITSITEYTSTGTPSVSVESIHTYTPSDSVYSYEETENDIIQTTAPHAESEEVTVCAAVIFEQTTASSEDEFVYIDLSTASADELKSLDGVGDVIAQRIVEYRTAHGGFSSIDDLKFVSGIGDKKFEAIKNHVYLSYTVPASPKTETYHIDTTEITRETTVVTTSETTNVTFLLVNINTAGIDELMELDGIGETIAQRIIDYRNEHGKFTSIEEIKNVSGIGDKRYEKIKDHICV